MSLAPVLLTPREYEVLTLLVRGKVNKEIAVTLGISVKTVEGYRAKLMLKFNVHSLIDLANSAYRLALVPFPQHHKANTLGN
jgi:DNA-binding NarL/FixJ family response regulator